MQLRGFVLCVVLAALIGGLPRFAIADHDEMFTYVLKVQSSDIQQGKNANITITLTNNSGNPINVIGPQFVLRVEGHNGHDVWPIDPMVSHRRYTILNGQTTYLWGSSIEYYPLDFAQHVAPGTYVLRYCDVLGIQEPREYCSNRVELHVRKSDDDREADGRRRGPALSLRVSPRVDDKIQVVARCLLTLCGG